MRLLWPKILVSLLQCGVTLFINPQLKAKGADKQPVQLTSFTTDLGHFPSTNPTVRSPPWSAVASTLLYYLLVQTQCVVPHEYHYSRAVAERKVEAKQNPLSLVCNSPQETKETHGSYVIRC